MSAAILPYGRQFIEDDDIAEVVRVLRSDYLTTGPEVPAFEQAFAQATGARHAIACSSGTAALHLMALGLGLGPGTSTVVPSITFLATASAVRLSGGEVVFADVDPLTGLLGPQHLEAALRRAGEPVKAIIPVHLGGQTCDLPALAAIARRVGATLLEDACHALGTTYPAEGARHAVGSCRHAAAASFSLHPVKTIAAGEGGVVTTNDDALADRMRLLRNHGMVREPARITDTTLALDPRGEPNPWYYEMPEPGLNYRLTDIQAALARSQLGKLERFAATRRALATRYDSRLRGANRLLTPVQRVAGCDPVLHLYQVLIDFAAAGTDRARLMGELRAAGIGTQVHYIPVHRQPYYAARYRNTDLPGADAFYRATLSLPLHAGMTPGDVDRVADALLQLLPA